MVASTFCCNVALILLSFATASVVDLEDGHFLYIYEVRGWPGTFQSAENECQNLNKKDGRDWHLPKLGNEEKYKKFVEKIRGRWFNFKGNIWIGLVRDNATDEEARDPKIWKNPWKWRWIKDKTKLDQYHPWGRDQPDNSRYRFQNDSRMENCVFADFEDHDLWKDAVCALEPITLLTCETDGTPALTITTTESTTTSIVPTTLPTTTTIPTTILVTSTDPATTTQTTTVAPITTPSTAPAPIISSPVEIVSITTIEGTTATTAISKTSTSSIDVTSTVSSSSAPSSSSMVTIAKTNSEASSMVAITKTDSPTDTTHSTNDSKLIMPPAFTVKGNSVWKWPVIGVCIAVTVILAIVVTGILYVKYRPKQKSRLLWKQKDLKKNATSSASLAKSLDPSTKTKTKKKWKPSSEKSESSLTMSDSISRRKIEK